MTKYTQWQKSWDKWSGDLWGRLEKALSETPKEVDNLLENIRRQQAFSDLLWHSCSYCEKYLKGVSCDQCPLNERKACFCFLANADTLTTRMSADWAYNDKEEFLKNQQQFLKALEETKFPDEEGE